MLSDRQLNRFALRCPSPAVILLAGHMKPGVQHLTEEALSWNLTVMNAELSYTRGGSHPPGALLPSQAAGD